MAVQHATGFELTAEEYRKAHSTVDVIARQHGIQDMEEKREWKVYRANRPEKYKHHSIVMEDISTKMRVCFHIVVSDKVHLIIDADKHMDILEYSDLGAVKMTVEQIVEEALETVQEFGDYDYYANNCQDFAQKFAERLGTKGYWTDMEKAAVGGGIALTAAAIFGGIAAAWYFSGSDNKDKAQPK